MDEEDIRRPKVFVPDRSTMPALRAFADTHDISTNVVYGYAFARLRSRVERDGEQFAKNVRQWKQTNE
jgi:hypothetical protein